MPAFNAMAGEAEAMAVHVPAFKVIAGEAEAMGLCESGVNLAYIFSG